MSLTTPFADDTPQLLTQSLRHQCQADAYVLTDQFGADFPDGGVLALDIERLQVGWDETRAPRVRAAVTCQVPTDQRVLDALDPRAGVRVDIWAGYVHPGGQEDVHPIAILNLRSRRVTRPGNLMELDLVSDEAIVTDTVVTAATYTPTQTSVAVAVEALLGNAYPAYLDFLAGAGVKTAPVSAVALVKGDDYFSVMDDLADQINADLYDDGRRVWHLDPRATIAGASAAALKVGTNGTIVSSDAELSREGEWANAVLLKYEFLTGTTPTVVWGYAEMTTGRFSVALAGRRVYQETRKIATSAAAANLAASAVLARRVSRGRGFRLRAVAAYWIRPGMTVTVQLPTGDQERHLVSAVLFDPTAGWMELTTRLPDLVLASGE